MKVKNMVILVIILFAVLVIGVSQPDNASAKVKYKLVKEFTFDFRGTKPLSKYIFKYNKHKDPITIILYERDPKFNNNNKIIGYTHWKKTESDVIKYKYKNGKKISRTTGLYSHNVDYEGKVTYDTKARPISQFVDWGKDQSILKIFYKNGYYRYHTLTTFHPGREDEYPDDGVPFVDNCQTVYIQKSGLPKRIVSGKSPGIKYLCEYPDVTLFNKHGWRIKDYFPKTIKQKKNYTIFNYKTNKGLITKVIGNHRDDGGHLYKTTYNFKYTKKTISKKRYACMINSLLEENIVSGCSDVHLSWY